MTKEEFKQALKDNDNSYFEKNGDILYEYASDICSPFFYIDEIEDFLSSCGSYFEAFRIGLYSCEFNPKWDIFVEDPCIGLISYPKLIDFVREEIDVNDFFEWLENN